MTKLVRSPFWWENFWPCFPSILSHCRPVCPQLVLSYIWSVHQELDKKNKSWQIPNEMLIWRQKTFGPIYFTFSQWFDLSVIHFLEGIIHPRMKCDMAYPAGALRVHFKCFCDQQSLGSLPLLPFGLLTPASHCKRKQGVSSAEAVRMQSRSSARPLPFHTGSVCSARLNSVFCTEWANSNLIWNTIGLDLLE